MKKLSTIFLGVGLILATVPIVTLEKTDEHLLITVGGAIPELIVRVKETTAPKTLEIPAKD